MPTPQRGVAYTFTIGLFDVANPGRLKTTPTLAAGDFTLSQDGGALANLATLPSETPAGSGLVRVSLSAQEMTADQVSVKWSDPDLQWSDGHAFFDVPVTTLDRLGALPLVEGYAADGVAPTLEQALCMLLQGVLEFGIEGTALTTRKLDKSTPAMVHTLDSATAPTRRTRVT